ncbi:MAG: TIGR03905 family TSCPD domain-containing protein [Clostridia bacterium]|nr:TIGR03905 family TSCPD domain-containing protein [Clostridia bacterium]
MHFDYPTEGTCSQVISFDLEDGRVKNVSFYGGCDGNLKAMSKLVEGMPAEQLVESLGGIRCGRRPTSCADQLARAVCKAAESERQNMEETKA